MLYLKSFLIAFVVSVIITFLIKKFALKFQIGIRFKQSYALNHAENKKVKKIHQKKIPLLGGTAMISAFILAIFFTKELVISFQLWGVLLGLAVIFFAGIWDDLKELSWKVQIFFQTLVALIVVAFGVRVDYLANPFGGMIRLDQIEFSISNFSAFGGSLSAAGIGAVGGHFPLLSSLFIIFWIILIINIFNWLDGIDGLAGGIGVISGIILFFLCLTQAVNQPPLAILSITLAGAVLGFLIFNFPPAKIFMGSSGSMFLGFTVGVLAIFSGAKVATILLVMGFPILDGLWVISQRIKNKKSPFKKDRRHLHYKLLSLGFSQRTIILFIYSLCALFGFIALFVQGFNKLIALIVLTAAMILIAFIVTLMLNKKKLTNV
jgi:UDP-GlcNAc:undecaprenyl-phosphate GlcNAc-1-phosphate transferase